MIGVYYWMLATHVCVTIMTLALLFRTLNPKQVIEGEKYRRMNLLVIEWMASLVELVLPSCPLFLMCNQWS